MSVQQMKQTACFLIAGLAATACATDPALVDPDEFRAAAQTRVERVVDVPAPIAASNLNGWAVKCWESSDIRVKYQQTAPDRYQVTIGMYGSSVRSLLFVTDITPNGNGAKVVVNIKGTSDLHRGYAENIAAGADKSAKECNSPIVGAMQGKEGTR